MRPANQTSHGESFGHLEKLLVSLSKALGQPAKMSQAAFWAYDALKNVREQQHALRGENIKGTNGRAVAGWDGRRQKGNARGLNCCFFWHGISALQPFRRTAEPQITSDDRSTPKSFRSFISGEGIPRGVAKLGFSWEALDVKFWEGAPSGRE